MQKTRPIILNSDEIKKILSGEEPSVILKLIKPQPWTQPTDIRVVDGFIHWKDCSGKEHVGGKMCPYGVPGDLLWVRESWADVNTDGGPALLYRADGYLHFCSDDAWPVEYDRYPGCKFTMWCGDLERGAPGHSWKGPIAMPRWASRITLELLDTRVLQTYSKFWVWELEVKRIFQ